MSLLSSDVYTLRNSGYLRQIIRIDNVRFDVRSAILVIFSDIEQQDSTGIE